MRHLFGFVLGVVLTGIGAASAVAGTGDLVRAAQVADPTTLGNVLVLAGGVVLGLVAALRRLSPLVPLVGGLLLLAAGAALWVRPGLALDVDLGFDSLRTGLSALPVSGTALLVGALLVVLALVPQARRPRRARDDDGRDDDGFTALPDAEPQAWRPPSNPSTDAYPTAQPYQRPPLQRPPS